MLTNINHVISDGRQYFSRYQNWRRCQWLPILSQLEFSGSHDAVYEDKSSVMVHLHLTARRSISEDSQLLGLAVGYYSHERTIQQPTHLFFGRWKMVVVKDNELERQWVSFCTDFSSTS
jgi:hypothetical protein